MRVVTLLPSATDIVVALGAGDDLVGVSHSCSPEWAHLPVLTSTIVDYNASAAAIDAQVKEAAAPLYMLDVELLERLKPDVIISQSLCDVCAVATGDVEEAVANLSSKPVLLNLAPFRLGDVPDDIRAVTAAIGRETEAAALLQRWNETLARFAARAVTRETPPRIAFLDWLDPPFAAGHWVPDMLELLGCESVLAKPGEPSHEISWDRVREAAPDLVIAACCGQTVERAAVEKTEAMPPIVLLDGQDRFSRPSPALLDSLAELDQALVDKGL